MNSDKMKECLKVFITRSKCRYKVSDRAPNAYWWASKNWPLFFFDNFGKFFVAVSFVVLDMAIESSIGLIVENTMENIKMIKNMVLVDFNGQMETFLS